MKSCNTYCAFALLLAAAGCLEYEAPPAELEVLAVFPDRIPPEAEVAVVLSAPLAELPALQVDRAGAVVPCEVRLSEAQVILTPLAAWPAGSQLRIRITTPLRSVQGAELMPEGGVLGEFSVLEAPQAAQPLTLLGPWTAPANLRWLLLAGPEAELEAMGPIFMTGYGEPQPGRVLAKAGGRALVEVDPGQACAASCGARSYRVQVMPKGLELGQVLTSSAVDRRPPTVQWVQAEVRGAGVRVKVFADEPVVVQGALHPQEGPSIPLSPPLQVATEVWLEASAPLDPNTRFRITLDVWDVAGNHTEAPLVEVQTADVPRVHISEVVAGPLRDWSDSDGQGVPFDPWPGLGAVNDNDEWVELVNLSDRAVDLLRSDLELRALDGSPSVTPVDAAPALYFGSGGGVRSWKPGEALVVRPRGSLSQRELRLELYGSGVLLDAVQLGGPEAADHPGGAPPDTVHEAVARDETGVWRWCVPSPGDPGANRSCR